MPSTFDRNRLNNNNKLREKKVKNRLNKTQKRATNEHTKKAPTAPKKVEALDVPTSTIGTACKWVSLGIASVGTVVGGIFGAKYYFTKH